MRKLVLAILGTAAVYGADDMAARKLFYQDNEPEVVFKAVAAPAKPKTPTTVAQMTPPVAKKNPVTPPRVNSRPPQLPPNSDMLASKSREALQDAVAGYTPDGTPVRKASNLGVSYNIMKVTPDTGARVSVPADTTFKKGDCVAIRMAPNRGGFLYVFNQATSGRWQPLIPSEDLPEEPATVKPYQMISIPSQNCFEMDDPAGDERLFVMVTEKPEDIKNLDEMLRKLGKPAQAPTPNSPQRADTMLLAQNNLTRAVNGFQSQLASRDIKITKVAQPQSKGELPYTVYYLNAAASPTDNLLLEIKLKHN